MVSVYKMGGMSLGDIMKAEAEKKGVDVDAAMRLHSQYAAKAKSDGTAPKAMPKQLDSRYLSQNQAQHCWCVLLTHRRARSRPAPLPTAALRACLCLFNSLPE